MTAITNFSEAFWDKDISGTSGFETLVKRMKEGRHMCKEFDEFLRQRARIEEDYGRSLQKLVRSYGHSTEIGSLKTSWEAVKTQTDKLASEHLEASAAMLEASRRLADLTEKNKHKCKQEEENTRKLINKKNNGYKRLLECKKSYEKTSRDAEQIDLQVNLAKTSGVGMGTKEWEKLYGKQIKTRQDADKADLSYKSSLDNLEHLRQQWEREMTSLCCSFQAIEEERINNLRNEMWAHSNIISSTASCVDQHAEDLRKVLEQCSVEKDITLFITERKTGLDKPSPIVYEPYTSEGRGTLRGNSSGSTGVHSGRPPIPLPEHSHGPVRPQGPRRPVRAAPRPPSVLLQEDRHGYFQIVHPCPGVRLQIQNPQKGPSSVTHYPVSDTPPLNRNGNAN